MPLQNRVTPLGECLAVPSRGLVYGNRACLHDDTGHIRRRYAGRRWIACRLRFRGWRRHPLMQPGRFTELFFLDEATLEDLPDGAFVLVDGAPHVVVGTSLLRWTRVRVSAFRVTSRAVPQRSGWRREAGRC